MNKHRYMAKYGRRKARALERRLRYRKTLREIRNIRETNIALRKWAARLFTGQIFVTDNPPKMPMYKPGMLTYKNPPMSVRMPWYEARKPEIIISKESRERILARMKEVSECVANCGVSADRLAQRLREFAEAGRPKYTPDEKASGTVVRDERRERWNAALETASGTCGNCGSEVQPGANVMLPMSEDE